MSLQAEPSSGFIMPGEKADVALEVFVDKRTAGGLNSGQDKLYDILVPTTFLYIVLVSHSLFIRIYLHCHGDLNPLIFLNLKLAPLHPSSVPT